MRGSRRGGGVEWGRVKIGLKEKSRAKTKATTHPAALCRRDGLLHLCLNLPAWKHRLVVHRVNRKIASQVKNVQSTGPAPGNPSNLKLIFQRRQAGIHPRPRPTYARRTARPSPL